MNMGMGLARIAIAALISGTAIFHAAGPGSLTVELESGTLVQVFYEDRDGNGYLNFNAPSLRNRDVLTGASVVSE